MQDYSKTNVGKRKSRNIPCKIDQLIINTNSQLPLKSSLLRTRCQLDGLTAGAPRWALLVFEGALQAPSTINCQNLPQRNAFKV